MSRPAYLPSAKELQQKLHDVLGITPDDIATNRGGSLSEKQQAYFAQWIGQGQRATAILVPLVILLAVGIVIFQIATNQEQGKQLVATFNNPETMPILVIGVGGSLLLFLVMVMFSMLRGGMTPAKMKVNSVTGNIKLTSTQVVGAIGGMMSVAGAPTTTYELKVGRQKIYTTNPDIERALVQDAPYTIYFVKISSLAYFVSAEAA